MKIKAALILIPMALLLSGCWDKLELEEQAYVVVLGLDTAKDNNVNVTFQIANPQVGSTDKGNAPNEPPSDTITFSASDILAAKELANSVVTRKLSFAHLRTLVISEEMAKSNLLANVLGSSMRDPELRREINIVVSPEKSSQFIHKNKPKLETRPHKYYAFMQQRWRDTAHVPYATLNRYMQRVHGELFLAIYGTTERLAAQPSKDEDSYKAGEIPQKAGDPVQIMGSAVLRNGLMIGTLTGEETRHALLLRKKALAHNFVSSFPDPQNRNYRITLRLIKEKNSKIKINVKKDPPEVDVEIPITLQILSIPSLINYVSDLNNQKLLKQAVKEELENTSKRIVAKCQKNYQGEPFIWYLEARKQFRTMDEFEQYDWEKKFTEASVNIKYDLKIESFGKQMAPQRIEQED
ncbi:Ger(x)C family spore germination protein [Paenibacillus anseongense]|uniref:Ger(x)C family spore germination protein n=1 Tax=Paenibacillus anseongense TaxID=2682845 RepID=UPI002DBAF340|nr:Ger(x)C family spore germination protein [Paenibacillus anseongense]MEC0267011.1 Ger(x)C family spore germination protein [Paenibacillus anseongense]